MKNFSKIWLIPLLPIMIMVGCEKRLGITYPTTVTPGTLGTSTATRTITRTMNGTATKSPVVSATTTSTITPTSTITGTATQSPVCSATETSTITATYTVTIVPTAAAAIPTVGGGRAQWTPVLGPSSTLSTFVILSDQAITNIPYSRIIGDVGISPGARSSMTGGLETKGDPQITGTGGINAGGAYSSYASDDLDTVNGGSVADMLIAAKAAALAAYNDAVSASRGTATSIGGDINGLTLAPGLYESLTSIEISPGGFLYLDGMGVVNATFIIRSSTSITTESTSNVVLTGGTLAKNVFWVAGSAITLGTNSIMEGTLIASTSISLLTGAKLDGRALIQGAVAGQVSLDQNTVIKP